MNPLFFPVSLDASIEPLWDGVTRQFKAQVVSDQRGAIANLILLAKTLNFVTDEAINQFVQAGWLGLYDGYAQCASALAAYLNRCAANVAGCADPDDFSPLGLALECGEQCATLVVWLEPRFSQFSLSALPPELGRLVAGCLDYVVAVSGMGMTTDDLLNSGACYVVSEELDALNDLDESIRAQDPGTLAQYLMDNETYPFCEGFEDVDALAERLRYLSAIEADNLKTAFELVPDIDVVAETMMIWRQDEIGRAHV
jgi:hypothetical protein